MEKQQCLVSWRCHGAVFLKYPKASLNLVQKSNKRGKSRSKKTQNNGEMVATTKNGQAILPKEIRAFQNDGSDQISSRPHTTDFPLKGSFLEGKSLSGKSRLVNYNLARWFFQNTWKRVPQDLP